MLAASHESLQQVPAGRPSIFQGDDLALRAVAALIPGLVDPRGLVGLRGLADPRGLADLRGLGYVRGLAFS